MQRLGYHALLGSKGMNNTETRNRKGGLNIAAKLVYNEVIVIPLEFRYKRVYAFLPYKTTSIGYNRMKMTETKQVK